MILVNHDTHATAAVILKAANYAAVAVNLNIRAGTYDMAGKEDGEIDHRTHGDIAIHGEEDTVGGDVLRFRRVVAALRFQFHGKMQRKTRSTLHIGIVLQRRLLLRIGSQFLL